MATAAEPLKAWLELAEQFTDQVALTGVATLGASGVSATTWDPLGDTEQSPGAVKLRVVSELTGFTVPLLWMVAFTVTLNGVPALVEAGAATLVLVTLTSAVAVMLVDAPPVALLLAAAGSLT